MYQQGLGVDQNFEEVVKWMRLAAEHGYALAQYRLGTIYHAGKNVEQDLKEAAKWYKLAAEQGNADAQINLGKLNIWDD